MADKEAAVKAQEVAALELIKSTVATNAATTKTTDMLAALVKVGIDLPSALATAAADEAHANEQAELATQEALEATTKANAFSNRAAALASARATLTH